jgi:hypothetical protein
MGPILVTLLHPDRGQRMFLPHARLRRQITQRVIYAAGRLHASSRTTTAVGFQQLARMLIWGLRPTKLDQHRLD